MLTRFLRRIWFRTERRLSAEERSLLYDLECWLRRVWREMTRPEEPLPSEIEVVLARLRERYVIDTDGVVRKLPPEHPTWAEQVENARRELEAARALLDAYQPKPVRGPGEPPTAPGGNAE